MEKTSLKKYLKSFKENTYEYHKVINSIITYTPKDGSILDVGCGYGQYLKPLHKQFPNVIGVETNKYIKESLQKEQLNVITPEEFEKSEKQFDTILMSHIIEHFYPDELIAIPTLNKNFFIDFDHKRPYYPTSIEEVFDGKHQQVKSYSKNSLKIIKVWFRRSRLQINNSSLQYNNKYTKNIITLTNILLAILFRYSFQIIGTNSGWIGVFKKI